MWSGSPTEPRKPRLEAAGYGVEEDDQADLLDFNLRTNKVVFSTTSAAGR
jgi:hypothetical protein